jgi:predicted metal-dependent peptidase
LCQKYPELEVFCGLLAFQADEQTTTLSTDGVAIYYPPQVYDDFQENLPRLYTHILFHCIYLHPFSNRQDARWQLACDIAVEYQVDHIFGYHDHDFLKRQMVYEQLQRNIQELTAEEILSCLKRRSLETLQKLIVLFHKDSHSRWNNNHIKTEHHFSKKYTMDAPVQWEKVTKQWATGEGVSLAKHLQNPTPSDHAGNRQDVANLTQRQDATLQSYLKQFMTLREDCILDLDSYDPVYYTYGLSNYHNIPFIEPLETKEVLRLDEIVIVIDTSGSCSGKLVRFFLEETWSVFQRTENFFNHFHVRILQCDSCIQEDVKLTNLQAAQDYMQNFIIRGGGGTDFRIPFSYIKQLQSHGEMLHIKGMLYFTDGFGTFPVQQPDYHTAFVFLKSRYGQVSVPQWADKLLLELPKDADWEPEYTGAFH